LAIGLEWIRDHPLLLTGLFIASAVVFVVSLVAAPRKYRLERWLVSRRNVHAAINWMRRRSTKPPLRHPGYDARV